MAKSSSSNRPGRTIQETQVRNLTLKAIKMKDKVSAC